VAIAVVSAIAYTPKDPGSISSYRTTIFFSFIGITRLRSQSKHSPSFARGSNSHSEPTPKTNDDDSVVDTRSLYYIMAILALYFILFEIHII